MQWFRNRKTVTKLMLGFGFMAALICLLGFEGVRSVIALNAATRDMYEHHVVGLSYIKDADNQIIRAGKSMRNAIMANNAADREARIAQLIQDREAFLADLESFQKCLVVDGMKVSAVALVEEFKINARAQDKVVDLIRANQRERAIAAVDGLNSLEKRRNQLVAELVRNEMDIMKRSADEVQATALASRTTMVTLALVAVALALVFGIAIARIITGPLGKMVVAAKKLEAGEVNQEIDYTAADEIGTLADAFRGLIGSIKGLTAESSGLVEAARQGRLQQRGDASKFTGAFRELVLGINDTLKAFANPMQEASSVLEKVASRDLTARMEGDYQGDFASMKASLNTAVTTLEEAMAEVRTSAEQVSTTAQELSSASETIASGAQEQASSLEETAASLEEMTSTVKQNADNARQASQLAAGSRESAEKGGQVVTAAVNAMGEINASSKRIAEIITTIDEIAFQTNLLALNAAVEAARAGEQGRGFAVVAAEVRNLAQRSATAAKEIKGLIQDSVRKVDNGSELVNRSGQTLQEIVQSVKRVTDIVAEIAAASQEQATGIDQVNKATMQMDQVTQVNSSQTEEMSSTAEGLSANAEQLRTLVGAFKLGSEHEHEAAARTGVAKVKTTAKIGGRKTQGEAHKETESLTGLAKVGLAKVGLAKVGLVKAGQANGTRGDSDHEFDEF